MQDRHLFGLSLLCFLLMNTSIIFAEAQNHITFKVDIYKNDKCSGKSAPIIIDTSKPCNSYSYVDSKGITINGSQNHVRCYKDKMYSPKNPTYLPAN